MTCLLIQGQQYRQVVFHNISPISLIFHGGWFCVGTQFQHELYPVYQTTHHENMCWKMNKLFGTFTKNVATNILSRHLMSSEVMKF